MDTGNLTSHQSGPWRVPAQHVTDKTSPPGASRPAALTPYYVQALKTWKPQRISFFELPAEIRNHIYRYVFTRPDSVPTIFNTSQDWTVSSIRHTDVVKMVMALTHTCKKIESELLPLFLAETRFRLLYSTVAPNGWFYNRNIGGPSTTWSMYSSTLFDNHIYASLHRAGQNVELNLMKITLSIPYRDMDTGDRYLFHVDMSIQENRAVVTANYVVLDNKVGAVFFDEFGPRLERLANHLMSSSGTPGLGLGHLEAIRQLLDYGLDDVVSKN